MEDIPGEEVPDLVDYLGTEEGKQELESLDIEGKANTKCDKSLAYVLHTRCGGMDISIHSIILNRPPPAKRFPC